MNAEEEAAYWDWVAKDSIRIEAEVWSDLDTGACLDVIIPHLNAALDDGWILDLGCGPGRLTIPLKEAYPKAHFIGVDSSRLMIETAELQTVDIAWYWNNGRDLVGVTDQRVDAAYSMTTFQHIPPEAQQQYLREIRRVLKPGGIFRLQFVYEGEEGPLSYPTPVKQMLGWCDEAGLRETDIGMGLIHDEWCWLTLVKA